MYSHLHIHENTVNNQAYGLTERSEPTGATVFNRYPIV